MSEPRADPEDALTPTWAVTLGSLAIVGTFAPIVAVVGGVVCIATGRRRAWVVAFAILIALWFLKEIMFSGDLLSPETVRWLGSYWVPDIKDAY